MRGFLLSVVLALVAAAGRPADPLVPVALRDAETVVIYGDSITQQNLYSAYLETFLASRFPHKRIGCFNFGWGGDTASGGHRRFERDVAPVNPTLVFVAFGMNDGGYKPYQEGVYRDYLDSQTRLAEAIERAGARQVLLTSSPVDPDLRDGGDAYNRTLARMADGLVELGAARGLPVIDLFHPMLEVQRQAKQRQPGFTMIPDSIHPDAVGHLVMAYLAIRGLEAPRGLGEIVIAGDSVTGGSAARVANVEPRDAGAAFTLDLDFLPFYVPPDARPALELVPFQEELNRFRLRREGGGAGQWALSVDGATLGLFSGEQLAQGIDLALQDKAPWAVAGRLLWEAAQYRWQKHQEAWRFMALTPTPVMLSPLPTFAPLAAAQRAHADAMGRSLQSLVQPRRYRVRLAPLGDAVPLDSVALSPTYPFDGGFERAHAPETAPESVEWKPARFEAGQIDLGARYERSSDVVVYARVRLQADAACTLHLAMGSDDGLAVFLDGAGVFANDVYRSLTPGQDELELELSAGRHELLFKVTQSGGDFALDVQARVYGAARVRQVPEGTGGGA